MRYMAPVNVWDMSTAQLRKLQPGQMVYAGTTEYDGRFLGVKASGSVVVAWSGNVRGQRNKREYLRTLRDYARSK